MHSSSSEIERDEGRVSYAYKDHLGYLTIGVGFLIDSEKGGRIPDAVIDFWLNYKIDEVVGQLRERCDWFDSLDSARQDAMINMAYQLGVDGFMKFKSMLHSMAMRDYGAAADHALDSLWARQTPERAKRVAEQLRTGERVGY